MRAYSEEYATFTIADAASLSAAVDLKGRAIKWVLVPTGTEGTHLRFYRHVAGTYYACRNGTDASVYTVAFTAGGITELDPAIFAGMKNCKVETCSAAAGTAQVQTGAATLTVGVI